MRLGDILLNILIYALLVVVGGTFAVLLMGHLLFKHGIKELE